MTVDGRDIQGWFLPAGVGPGPLVVEIHGGPHTLYGWAPVWEFQILAAAGIGVFYCNPRGSEGLRRGVQRRQPPRLGPRTDARRPRRRGRAGRGRSGRPGAPGRDRRVVRRLPDQLDRRPRPAVPGGDDLPLGQRHERPVHDRRHLRRRLGAARIRVDPVGRSRVLPRDLADHLRQRDPDAAPDPAFGTGHPDDHRPGRGAVHRPSLAPTARSGCCASPRRPTS